MVKKIWWVGGVAECCCDKLCGFQNLEQLLKSTRSIVVSKSDFADEECYIKNKTQTAVINIVFQRIFKA